MHLRNVRPTIVLLIIAATPALLAENSGSRPSYRAVRALKAPAVDGDLSDPAWQGAPEITGFTQMDPAEGKPATQQTRVKVVYDEDAIYFGLVMEDSAKATPLLARRDSDLNRGDYVRIAIDSQHDRLNGAAFIVGASNVQMDMVLYNDTYNDTSWDAVWESATKLGEHGWVAEVRIPYSQLRFPERDQHVWGFNVSRWNARLHEGSRLVYTPKKEVGFVSRFADLEGIEGIHPKRAFEIVPYAVARNDLYSRADNPFVAPSSQRMDGGVDLKYGLSSSLTLTGTINPDFGQVEVDPAVLNLTEFESFFPEKRPFFTEGANIFKFGSGPANSRWIFNSSSPTFFYSRRIGRSPQGSIDADWVDAPGETTILGAAKITGKVGNGWTVGALDALTDKEEAWYRTGSQVGKSPVEPMTNYLVARATKEYGRDSTAGFMFTSVNRQLSGDLEKSLRSNAYMGGVDGYTFFGNKDWLLEWLAESTLVQGSREAIARTQKSPARYYQRPDAEHQHFDPNRTSLDGWGGRVMLGKQTGVWRPNVQVMTLSPGLELNDVGFLPRTDTIASHAVMQYVNTEVKHGWRDREFWVGKYQNWNFDHDLTANGVSGNFYVENTKYRYLFGSASWEAPVIDTAKTRGGPSAIRAGGRDLTLGVGNDVNGRWWNETWGELQQSDDGGYNHSLGTTLQYRPGPSIRLRLSPTFTRSREAAQYVMTVADPAYTPTYGNRYIFSTIDQRTLDVAIRADWTLSARLSFQMFLQPFIASGSYHDFKQLVRPGADEYVPIAAAYDPVSHTYESNTGPTFSFGDPNFNLRSVRGSAVVRWELRPGSALYLVWNENRSDVAPIGDFRARRDFSALPDAPSQDVFLLKFSYWLPI